MEVVFGFICPGLELRVSEISASLEVNGFFSLWWSQRWKLLPETLWAVITGLPCLLETITNSEGNSVWWEQSAIFSYQREVQGGGQGGWWEHKAQDCDTGDRDLHPEFGVWLGFRLDFKVWERLWIQLNVNKINTLCLVTQVNVDFFQYWTVIFPWP